MVQKLEFLPRLESLRGLAAVSVVGYHAFGQFTDTYVTGMAPVVLFFVLSGFVLSRSLARNDDIAVFLRHRILRLFPAAIAVVLLLAALHGAFGFYLGFGPDFSPFNVLLNALMIRHDINGPMLSMTVECFATPVIVLAFLGGRRFGSRVLIATIAVLFGLSFIGPYVHLLGGYTNLAGLPVFGSRICTLIHVVYFGCWQLFPVALPCFSYADTLHERAWKGTETNKRLKGGSPMAWLFLLVAGLCETAWAIGLKYTEGFSRLLPTIGTVAAMVASFGFLGLAFKSLPVGTAYAVWTGIGTVGAAALGIYLFNEPATLLRLACIGLILSGVVGLKIIS